MRLLHRALRDHPVAALLETAAAGEVEARYGLDRGERGYVSSGHLGAFRSAARIYVPIPQSVVVYP